MTIKSNSFSDDVDSNNLCDPSERNKIKNLLLFNKFGKKNEKCCINTLLLNNNLH